MKNPAVSSSQPARLPLDYDLTLDCIHCGLCLNSCPTYLETGRESEGPRGRIHLMRAMAEGRLEADAESVDALNSCLVCRNCETVCPAGVQFGALMESARDLLPGPGLLGQGLRWLGFRLLLPNKKLLGMAAGFVRLAQVMGLPRLFAPLLGTAGKNLAHMPRFPKAAERRDLPPLTPGEGQQAVAILEGCVQRLLYGRVNRATVRVLNACGADVHTAPHHACCGALHAHNGDLAEARRLAQTTIAAFEQIPEGQTGPVPIVINSAGCGAHMAEYPRLFEEDPPWKKRAAAFAKRVIDFSAFVNQAPQAKRLVQQMGPAHGAMLKLAWDDPCHLCHGQQITEQPRSLLDMIPGTERVELPSSQSCCGSAGIHALLHPEESNALVDAKIHEFSASGADVLVTANPGCQMHWQAGFSRAGVAADTLHLAEVLAQALNSSSKS